MADTDRELDVQVAEKVMGLTLDWGHKDQVDIIALNRGANNGRGIYVRCWECGLHGYGNEVEAQLRQGCPTPACPSFTTDVSADYSVLEYVRANWRWGLRFNFNNILHDYWKGRNKPIDGFILSPGGSWYEPGDYSRAALAALEAYKSKGTSDG